MKSHQQLGEDMDLFHQDPHAPGMVLWHPLGARLFRTVAKHTRESYASADFQEVQTPQLMKQSLWETSGHLDHFSENMFLINDKDPDSSYAVKPMSCPGHILIYKRSVHSVKNLPVRLFEFGVVHRYEPSGALNGILRLRQFTQDDAHVFCAWEQAHDEVISYISRAKTVYKNYGLNNLSFKLSTRPEKAFGDAEGWLKAEELLSRALKESGIDFEIQVGEGAFYGPKIEIALQDSIGRYWQCGVIQLDFNLPERFDLSYRDHNQTPTRPVILHQAIYGSLERWIGVLLESMQGLPEWVHPQPIAILPVTESAHEYAKKIHSSLYELGLHSTVDESSASLARKLKRAHKARVALTLIVGEKEVSESKVVIRHQSKGSQITLPFKEALTWLQDII